MGSTTAATTTASPMLRARLLAAYRRRAPPPAVRAGVAAWGTTRSLYLALTFIAGLAMAQYHIIRTGPQVGDFLARWAFWDTDKWIGIAHGAYPTWLGLPAYFPLMGLLDWVGIRLLPFLNPIFVALLISNLCMLVAFIALADLLRDHQRLILPLLAAYPWMLFTASGYSDALGLATVAGALAAAQRRRYVLATLFAVAAGLARPTGIILVAPLAILITAQEHLDLLWRYPRLLWQAWREHLPRLLPLLCVLGAPLGVALYGLYCAIALHDPLAFIHAQHQFGRTSFDPLGGIWLTIRWGGYPLLSEWTWREALDVVPLAIALVAIPFVWRRLGAMWGSYLTGLVLVILLTPTTTAVYPYVSAGRYLLLAIPVPLLLAPWLERHPNALQLLTILGWATQAVMLMALFNGAWIV
jgi:hypothetical protein